jgi:hypothetical protein
LLTISCPHCQKTLKGKDDLAGHVVICPACKTEFEVPLPADWLAGIPAKQPEDESTPLDFLNPPNNPPPLPLSPDSPAQVLKYKTMKLSSIGLFVASCIVSAMVGIVLGILIGRENPALSTSNNFNSYKITQEANSNDPDLKLVRAYLHENLPSGKWEELRWWPKRESKIQQYGFHGRRTWSGGQVCRLKFRDMGDIPAINDIVFIVADNRAEPVYNYGLHDTEEWYQYVWNLQFPNDSQGLRISDGKISGASSYILPVAIADDDLHDTADIAAIKKLGHLDEKRPAGDSNRLDQVSDTPSRPANDPQSKKARDDRRDPKHIMQHP